MDEYLRVVEIGGVKVEVDLRTAKRVDQFRVGDRVKVLTKEYGGWKSNHGVIVAFDDFVNLPSITVCYIESGYKASLQFATLNAESKDLEITACNDDVLVDKGEVVARLQKEIDELQLKIADIERKRDYFLARFGAWFKDKSPDE